MFKHSLSLVYSSHWYKYLKHTLESFFLIFCLSSVIYFIYFLCNFLFLKLFLLIFLFIFNRTLFFPNLKNFFLKIYFPFNFSLRNPCVLYAFCLTTDSCKPISEVSQFEGSCFCIVFASLLLSNFLLLCLAYLTVISFLAMLCYSIYCSLCFGVRLMRAHFVSEIVYKTRFCFKLPFISKKVLFPL